jgi:hypothetical protein
MLLLDTSTACFLFDPVGLPCDFSEGDSSPSSEMVTIVLYVLWEEVEFRWRVRRPRVDPFLSGFVGAVSFDDSVDEMLPRFDCSGSSTTASFMSLRLCRGIVLSLVGDDDLRDHRFEPSSFEKTVEHSEFMSVSRA